MSVAEIRTNFSISQSALERCDALVVQQQRLGPNTLLPYIFWAIDFIQYKGDEVVDRKGPGYMLGAIYAKARNENALLVRTADHLIIVTLRDPYDARAHYVIDWVDDRMTIEAR
jgi:hypothetical protein